MRRTILLLVLAASVASSAKEKPVKRGGWRIAISSRIPQGFSSCYDFAMRDLIAPCGVASRQTPTPDRESLSATITRSARVGPDPRGVVGTLGASNSSAPFRNRTEALDIVRPSQSHEPAKVPDAVLIESPAEARPERTERRTHPCGRRNEAA